MLFGENALPPNGLAAEFGLNGFVAERRHAPVFV
jgi:hypothetical protein